MNFIYRLVMIAAVLVLANVTPVHAESLAQLLQQGQENLENGHFYAAKMQFAQAEQQATEQQDSYNLVLIKALQGYMASQRQNDEEAEQLLTSALEQAKTNNWYDLSLRTNLYLGQLDLHSENIRQATEHFQQAISQPEQVTDKALLVSGFYQLAKIDIEHRNLQQAAQHLQQAKALMSKLPANPANSELWLTIGYKNLQLYQLSPKNDFLVAAFSDLNHALALARQNKQSRIQTAALKHLAYLYKQQQRNNEAIQLLQEAINIAQKADANDALIDLNWHAGQLYQQQNQPKLAIAVYREAVKNIDTVRLDIPVSYQHGQSSFRETFAPIYLGLADLLLRQSAVAKTSEQQALLAEAQDSIERLKKSELEDYFQSRCDISATPINLKKTDTHAAAIYPISLPDRLEIIIYSAAGLQRFSSPVTAKELEQRVRQFSSDLRNYKKYVDSKKEQEQLSHKKQQAQRLYHWLIAPAEAFLKQQNIETLVYMPDGVLRLMPLAALHDGKQFVIENYAVVTSPGMSLIASENHQYQSSMLLAGMSLPGDVVKDLPDSFLSPFMGTTPEKTFNRSLTRDLQRAMEPIKKRELTASQQQEKKRDIQEFLKKPEVIDNLQKILTLPGVDTEIKELAEKNNTGYLLNDGFTLENFTHTLTETPHTILHIASHGVFGNTAEDSFIMTYDKILNLNQLETLLSSDYFRQHPIDLLTLSACQTAEGDDRSPLGISGVAIKAKVHSALGSLWSVADDATAELMTTFYQSLKKPNQTKAKALQEAMLKLLQQKDFADPFFWSPFILIGNWM